MWIDENDPAPSTPKYGPLIQFLYIEGIYKKKCSRTAPRLGWSLASRGIGKILNIQGSNLRTLARTLCVVGAAPQCPCLLLLVLLHHLRHDLASPWRQSAAHPSPHPHHHAPSWWGSGSWIACSKCFWMAWTAAGYFHDISPPPSILWPWQRGIVIEGDAVAAPTAVIVSVQNRVLLAFQIGWTNLAFRTTWWPDLASGITRFPSFLSLCHSVCESLSLFSSSPSSPPPPFRSLSFMSSFWFFGSHSHSSLGRGAAHLSWIWCPAPSKSDRIEVCLVVDSISFRDPWKWTERPIVLHQRPRGTKNPGCEASGDRGGKQSCSETRRPKSSKKNIGLADIGFSVGSGSTERCEVNP